MVNQLVVTQTLTEQMIQAGADLVRALDDAGMNVTSALWFYLEDSDTWRLIFGSPTVAAEGPKRFYEGVQRVLTAKEQGVGISLRDITVVAPNDSSLLLLRPAIATGSTGIAGIRFSRNTINGHFIRDAYIYRLS
ncbi:MAG: hypothetical protein ACR2HH_03220 [Chthoniobacterales bacterium]